MDRKTVIKWLVGILVNLGALIAVYLTANPQVLSKSEKVKKQDSLDKIASARFVPSYSKSATPGLLSNVVNQVNNYTLTEQRKREARERKMDRRDSIDNRSKTSVHLLQQLFFDSLKKDVDALGGFVFSGNKTTPAVSGEAEWDEFSGIKQTGGFEGTYRLKTGIQVFGWHPYWMGSAYKTYNFSLLSTIAYYGAEISPSTGLIKTTHDWETTGLFKTTGDSIRVELTVINLGEDNNTDLFTSPGASETLIYELLEIVAKKGDGICLDFEGVPEELRDSLTNFVSVLRDSLNSAEKTKSETNSSWLTDYSITMVLPCFDWTNGYDVKKLATLVDRFVVTGYDYYGAESRVAGPVAPLTSGLEWSAPNIERSVNDYLKKGIPPSKLLLGLPYYGTKWQSINTKIPSAGAEFLGFPLYRRIRNDLALKEINYDTASVTGFYISNSTLPIQYWFDDTETLGEKYRYVLRNKLGGVGIWALGYDNGYPDLWRALRNNFGRDLLEEDTTYASRFPIAYRDTTALAPDKEWGIVAANGHYLIFDNPYVLLFGTLAVFAIILLLQVMLDDQPFNEFFSRRLLLFIASSLAGTIAILFLGLALWSRVPHREIYLLLAGIIGGYLLFRLTQRIVGKKEKLP
ncbi:MAG: glycoside hydrolase family 18 protein [Bacteroidota bacterium]|nr:glycoside hydrolase family 18 protein [Bacteroidota bacterium]